MPRLFLALIAFIAGLLVIAWVSVGYATGHGLALAVSAVVAAFYLAGALELWRFQQSTAVLRRALAGLERAPASLSSWLDTLPAELRPAVRLRVEGPRVALPGPSMTPYLVGLLVLLGMLGTFLGMVATLNGTGAALASADDLAGMRSALARPVQGLGLAFGTSVAGIAASAMLGLMSALLRRERAEAGLALDARVAGVLRPFSAAHQREQSMELLRRQGEAMPALFDRLQALMQTLEQQGGALSQRLADNQAAFHAQAGAAYQSLASAVDQSLSRSLNDSARAAADGIQPVVQATMAQIASEAGALHDRLGQSVQRQLDTLAAGFESSSVRVAQVWQEALATHQQGSEAHAGAVRAALEASTTQLGQQSQALVQGVAERLDGLARQLDGGWGEALAQQRAANETLVRQSEAALTAAAQGFGQQAAALVQGVDAAQARWQDEHASRDTARQQAWQQALDTQAAQLSQQWRAAGEEAVRHQGEISEILAQQRAANQALVQAVGEAQARWQDEQASRDAARQQAWQQALDAQAAQLREQWQAVGEESARRQAEISDTLAASARAIAAHGAEQTQATVAEMTRWVNAAVEAPRAATEVLAELRQKVADSTERDNAMLEERGRILQTLSTLLDAINEASGAQRGAIDALVNGASEALAQAGQRFAAAVDAQGERFAGASAQIAGSAIEVASLGESFGAAVEHFSATSEQLGERLQQIEAALAQSRSRSDEQLAYYVAQAREVVDLSLAAQQQLTQQLAQLQADPAAAQPLPAPPAASKPARAPRAARPAP